MDKTAQQAGAAIARRENFQDYSIPGRSASMTVDTALRQIFTVFFSRENGGGDGKEAVGGGGVRGALRLPAPGRRWGGAFWGALKGRGLSWMNFCAGAS